MTKGNSCKLGGAIKEKLDFETSLFLSIELGKCKNKYICNVKLIQ